MSVCGLSTETMDCLAPLYSILHLIVSKFRISKQREESVQSWPCLPEDLVVKISERLSLYTDYLRLRLVCKSWYSFLPKKPYHSSHHLPLLILHYTSEKEGTLSNGIFGLANNKLYHLPNPQNKFHNQPFIQRNNQNTLLFKGYSNGWLVLGRLNTIYLHNLFTNTKLSLPPIKVSDVQKVVLSSTPPADATTSATAAQFSHLITAICIYGINEYHQLLFARPGDKAWTNLKPKSFRFHLVEDVLFRGNKIYVLESCLKVYVFNMSGSDDDDMQIDSSSSYSILQPQLELKDEEFVFRTMPHPDSIEMYLVESSNDVLMVIRVRRSCNVGTEPIPVQYKTIHFMVFKWELKRWIHVKSLGEQMLFIGRVSSLSISSRDFPDCKGNCIYFTDANPKPNADYKGIFRLEDDCIESALPLQGRSGSEDSWTLSFHHPPSWLTFTYIHAELI